jgi:NarL family two-component system response regulator LiaR
MGTPLLGGVLIAGLKVIEYRWLVVEHSVEIYGALVAAVFASDAASPQWW